jgi:hypothetical protein
MILGWRPVVDFYGAWYILRLTYFGSAKAFRHDFGQWNPGRFHFLAATQKLGQFYVCKVTTSFTQSQLVNKKHTVKSVGKP